MKHKIGYNRLGRKTAHRKAMTRNMLTSLFRHERIRTTKAKALAVRRTAEKMITRAKTDSVHNRRMIGRDIKDQAVLAKMFTEIGPRFKERPGGYTRVLKLGPRPSDAAEMVILELLHDDESVKSGASSKSGKKKAASGSSTSKASGSDTKKSETKKTKKAPASKDGATAADAATGPEVAGEAAGEAEESTASESSAAAEPQATDEQSAAEGEATEDDKES